MSFLIGLEIGHCRSAQIFFPGLRTSRFGSRLCFTLHAFTPFYQINLGTLIIIGFLKTLDLQHSSPPPLHPLCKMHIGHMTKLMSDEIFKGDLLSRANTGVSFTFIPYAELEFQWRGMCIPHTLLEIYREASSVKLL